MGVNTVVEDRHFQKEKGEERETENMEPWVRCFSTPEYILGALGWDPYPTESQLS